MIFEPLLGWMWIIFKQYPNNLIKLLYKPVAVNFLECFPRVGQSDHQKHKQRQFASDFQIRLTGEIYMKGASQM